MAAIIFRFRGSSSFAVLPSPSSSSLPLLVQYCHNGSPHDGSYTRSGASVHYRPHLLLLRSKCRGSSSSSAWAAVAIRRMAAESSSTSATSSGNSAQLLSIDQLLCLSGTWRGKGTVLNSTGDEVAEYAEEAEFRPVRRHPEGDFVVYRHTQDTQRASSNNNKKPMHTETGFLKIMKNGTAVASFAHPFPSGFVDEMSEGTLEMLTDAEESATTSSGRKLMKLTLTAQDFQRANKNEAEAEDEKTNKKIVHGYQRIYTLEGPPDRLTYHQYLSTTPGPGGRFYHHLRCTLTKIAQ